MNQIFNTTFENSLRALIILKSANKSLDSDLLALLDFMSVYSKTLGLGEKDLNGENSFAFCEYANRRKKINNAIKELVLDNLIEVVQMTKGFCYKINKRGKDLVDNLNSTYAKEYTKSVKYSLEFVKGKKINVLLKFINDKANQLEEYDE